MSWFVSTWRWCINKLGIKHLCVLIHIRTKGEVGTVEGPPLNMFKPSSYFIADRSKVVFLLWILFINYVSCLSLLCRLVCSLQSCGHLLGKGDLLAILYVMFSCVFVTFPCGVPGQVCYLIVLIHDFCLPLLSSLKSSYGPQHEKTYLQGFRQSKTQTSPLSYRD